MKKKRKINGQKIFSFVSFIFIVVCILWYGGRFVYFYLDNKKTEVKEANTLARALIKENKDSDYFQAVNQDYYFKGDALNNYLMYSNVMWRIVKINQDNRITLISENVLGTLGNGKKEYTESNVIHWLNKVDNDSNSGVLERVLSNSSDLLVKSRVCVDTSDNTKKISCDKVNQDYLIGLLSLEDYSHTGGNKGFIHNDKVTYLSNKNKKKESWYITEEGKLDVDSNQDVLGVRPVITLNSSVEAISGKGTSDDPYVLREDKNYFARYVKLGDDLFQVYDVKDGVLKLSLNQVLENDGESFKYSYGKNTYQYNDTVYGSLAYYLNRTYYNRLSYKSIIFENSYVNGFYSSENSFSSDDIFKNVISTKVSIPSVLDIVVNDSLGKYLLASGVDEDSTSIYVRDNGGVVNTQSVRTEGNVVPCISIHETDLKTGSGTKDDPYRTE